MALNYSHRQMFSSHVVEDSLVSPMRVVNGYIVDGVNGNNRESFGNRRLSRSENEGCVGLGSGEVKNGLDLPSDPFGMDDISTTVSSITGWLEDLEGDYGGFGGSVGEACGDDDTFFAGLHLVWNNAMQLQSFPGSGSSEESPIIGHSVSQDCDRGIVDVFGCNRKGSSSLTLVSRTIERTESLRCLSEGNDGTPHDALFFALGYLGVKDLLSVDRVCRSLHWAVQTDCLLWRSILIDKPLNRRITDHLLFKLSIKAQGTLQSLCLVECRKITDAGLRRVVRFNPRLTKLCVPGCTKLSIDGIINIVKDANSEISAQAIKKLRINGIYGVTCTHINQLKSLLGCDKQEQQANRTPLFYDRRNFYLSCDDDRPLDIETCMMCQQPRLVYDCPECQVTSRHTQVCQACILCVQRCIDCGRCTIEIEYYENFYLDVQCSYCFKDPLKPQNKKSQNKNSQNKNSQNKLDIKSHRSNGGRHHNICHSS